MSDILATDPFALLAYRQDLIGTPLDNEAAAGADPLDVAQRAVTIGEPVPVVFCRRVGTVGGVLLSPGATEARFTNDAVTNAVTATYELVLGEGDMDQVQVRDTFQRSCRVGTLQQTYNRRAGTWTRGNFITVVGGFTKPECPYYCGTGGSYAGMTTASFEITAPDGDTRWNRQVHLFIRGGLYVTRLIDATLGPSNNFADLFQWLLVNTSRTPTELIDSASLLTAAKFTQAMGLFCDVKLDESQSLEDFAATNAKYFLLSKNRKQGKVGLRPLLPITAANEINTGTILPSTSIDEGRVIPDSFEITYIPLSDRKPFCAMMLWRQQPDNDVGLIRTTEVRYAGLAESGPFEQHDLSAFATSELHAVRVGAYFIARRRYITHTLRLRIRPSDETRTISRGDIVQVKLTRTPSGALPGDHNYLYEVDKVSKSRTGVVSLDLTHFPVDSLGRSLVALDVMAAVGRGVLLPTGYAATVSCDVNSSSDTTEASDVGEAGEDFDYESLAGGDGFAGDGLADGAGGGGEDAGGGDGGGEGANPTDNQGAIDVSKVPPGIGIGDSVPAPFLDKLGEVSDPLGEWEIGWPDYSAATWSITVTSTAKTANIVRISNGDLAATDTSGTVNVTFTSVGSAVALRPYNLQLTGDPDVGRYQHGIWKGNLIDVALGLAASVPPYTGGLVGGYDSGNDLTFEWPSGEPTLRISSMTRLT